MTRIVAVLLLLIFSGAAVGQYCSRLYCAPTYSYPTYYQPYYPPVVQKEIIKEVAPIAVPVLVPATVFQYLPALQSSITPVAVGQQQTSIQAAPTRQVQTQAQTEVRTQQQVRTQTQDIDRIVRERVDAILRERTNGNGNEDDGPPPLIIAGELPPQSETREQTRNSMQEQPRGGDINQQVANMLSGKSCVRCHTAGDKPVKGNVTLFAKKGQQLYFQPSVPKARILAAVTPDSKGSVAMPPDGEPLNAGELQLLKAWHQQK